MSKAYNDQSKKDLAEKARRLGIPDWKTLSKEQLIKALSKAEKIRSTPAASSASRKIPGKGKPPAKPTRSTPAPATPTARAATRKTSASAATSRKAQLESASKPAAAKSSVSKAAAAKASPPAPRVHAPIAAEKDLSSKGTKANGTLKDQIWLMVSDPFWLHACWELSVQAVQRAEAALGQDWHGARPVLRLFDVTSNDTTSTSETPIRDIVIHVGCNHWYIDVPQPPRTFRVDIGYLSRRGEFRPLARSNVVTTPKAGASEPLPENWATEIDETSAERILAMSTGFEQSGGPSQLRELFDEQFRRTGKEAAFGSGAVLPEKLKKFGFELHTELIVHGRTDASAHVTLQNEPVKLRADGTFTMRYALTDGRQIIPAVATSADGMEERTIVLAVERNTKHLDPMVHDLYNEV